MQRVRAIHTALVLACCALLLVGCRQGSESFCPTPTVEVEPETIPEGQSDTEVRVTVDNPNPDNGRDVVTELYANTGSFEDPQARRTPYTCAHDVSGEVEICVDAVYGPPIGPGPGSASEAIAAAIEYLRAPHAYFIRPEDCLETNCTTVVCPGEQNQCPVIDDFRVEPQVIMEGETAMVYVMAEDPDENPAPLVTTLVAVAGTFGDRFAQLATYDCDPTHGGPIEICVLASDGDERCDAQQCLTVQCPGPIPDNVCPVIRNLTATPSEIPPNQRQSVIEVDAFDPDAVNPDPLVTRLSASTGTFDDPTASTALYTCGDPGPAEICVKASDGDHDCDKERCIPVRCPSTVPKNVCPKLYTLNMIPSAIPQGQTWTEVEVRGEDIGSDGPLPFTTTLYALRGTFDDVHASDTIYHCERSGLNEICVDASDGACVKTQCEDVFCPDDL